MCFVQSVVDDLDFPTCQGTTDEMLSVIEYSVSNADILMFELYAVHF